MPVKVVVEMVVLLSALFPRRPKIRVGATIKAEARLADAEF